MSLAHFRKIFLAFICLISTPALSMAATLSVAGEDPACSDVTGTPFCTIGAAVTFASSGDTLTVDNGTYAENITVDKDLTIVGQDRESTVVDGGAANAVFSIIPPATAVGFQNLTIIRGGGVNGGGVQSISADVTVENCLFSHNFVTGIGGAIANFNASLNITDSDFEDNYAANAGGAIYNISLPAGSLTVSGSSFTSNVTGASGGGAIYNGMGELTITDSIFESNFTSSLAGAIAHFPIQPGTLVRVQVRNNLSNDTAGGLIVLNALTFTIEDSVFVGNTAQAGNGGAIYSTTPDLRITGTLIDSNLSGLHGAGLYLSGGAVIRNSTISNNLAKGIAGGLFNVALTDLTNVTISGNKAHIFGGGVFNGSQLGLANVTVVNNEADSNHDGTGNGGGIYHVGVSLTIKNSIVANNLDPSGWAPDCFGIWTSQGHNLIENVVAPFCTVAGDATGNLVGVEPLLGALRENGSQVITHALLASSPALDAGDPAGCTDTAGTPLATDARGQNRTADGNGDGSAICDMGAFEASGCGDFVVEEYLGEECDNGDQNSDTVAGACRTTCVVASCGDGVVDAGEVCDDGNVVEDDACTSSCIEPVVSVAPGSTSGSGSPGTGGGGGGGGCSLNPKSSPNGALLIFGFLFTIAVLFSVVTTKRLQRFRLRK